MALPNGNQGSTNAVTQYKGASYWKTAAQSILPIIPTDSLSTYAWCLFDDEGTSGSSWGYYGYPGSPEGVVAANKGSWCSDTSNGVLYTKTTNTVNTGWVSFAGGIHTINGDSGSISGASVTIFANNATNNAGATVKFVNSGTVSTFNVTDASRNTFIGQSAGNLTTTSTNSTCVGYLAGFALTSGGANTFFGRSAGVNCSTGVSNTIVGQSAGGGITTGGTNTMIGANTGGTMSTGESNVIIGRMSGAVYAGAESSNILISNAGTLAESNAIHIGSQGSGAGQQNTCYIAGIVGVTTANSQVVTINSATGQLGVSNALDILWTDVTGATQTLALGNGYVTDRGGGVTYTLPATATFGDEIKIVGKLGLTTIAQNANQAIRFGSSITTTGVGGSAAGINVGDCVALRCITGGASTIWIAESFVGNWSIV